MKKQVVNAISNVIDPEVGFDILALGLIYDIQIDNSYCKITMTLSTKSCPMHDLLITWVKDSVLSVDGIDSVDIDLVFEPAWSIEMASDEVKSALSF
ncbi:metal-sulfur cluster assembly factor [Campylobacter sp. 2018MI13]|uniref:metal-sulfur cluster assembly factor n=1 Tax=Campylobacter sp. 2018MI13 TaxID=2836737 RepID=UPI001BD9B09C|nr:metal-sulfur cluster assembly factor [Campylobacter sp. 2018MI13]MBT0882939.1 metal-sulfur cluster assembly factor [Campylobacter sp. 2018MI13]